MAFTSVLPDDFFVNLLREDIRRKLKVALMPIAESFVDKAVDEAVAGLATEIVHAREMYNMKDFFEVSVTRKENR